MLVLSRYQDEKIIIGDDIIVMVVDIRGDRVRLGITAPAHVDVYRQEIHELIQKEARTPAPDNSPTATSPADELAEKNQEIALLRKIIRNLCFFYHMTDVPENPFDDEAMARGRARHPLPALWPTWFPSMNAWFTSSWDATCWPSQCDP